MRRCVVGGRKDLSFQQIQRILFCRFDGDAQESFQKTAQNGQDTMRRDLMDGFAVIEIVAELGGFCLLFRDQPADQVCLVFKQFPDGSTDIGILAEFFRQDIPGALQGFFRSLNMLVQESLCLLHWVRTRLLFQQHERQRLQSVLTGDGRFRLSFRFIGQVDILEFRQRGGFVELFHDRLGHLPLFGDALDDGGFAIIELCHPLRFVLHLLDGHFVHRAGLVLPVTGDEGDRTAFVKKLKDGLHMAGTQIQLAGDRRSILVHITQRLFGKGAKVSRPSERKNFEN